MSERTKNLVLVGILICLLMIAFKPVPKLSINNPSNKVPDQVVQIATNRIGVVVANHNSGLYGTILVFDYDETNETFNLVGKFNYSDYIHNPQKYGIK